MPRDGSGNYSLASNTLAVSGDAISSTKFNSLVQDLESDANVDRPIAAGGTGASTASAARTNLGLAIGADVQAFDAGLLSIAGLTTAADRSIYTTASDTYAVYTLTAAGRAILDDADASAQRTTLGLGTIATQAANSVSITGGSITGITDLAIADGGTGASDAGAARTNLGLAIGTDVQAYDAGLQSIAGLTTVADRMIYTTASDTYAVTTLTTFGRSLVDDADASAARTTLGLANGATTTISAFALTMLDDADAAAVRTTIGVGLGTGDLVAANNLSDVANASTARTNLGLAIGTNVQAYDAGLQSIAGLTTEADRGIYTTASDTYAVYTLTSAGRAILDDADAAAQRTTLGLGTAAVVNTGTSGATIPLLNAANTWSGNQTFGGGYLRLVDETNGIQFSEAGGTLRWVLGLRTDITGNDTDFTWWSGSERMRLTSAGVLTIGGNTAWHAGNDGAGSTLDADTLDGVQGSAYATLAAVNTFTASDMRMPIASNGFLRQVAGTAHAAGNVGSLGLVINDGGNDCGVFVHNTHNGTYSSQDIRFLTCEGGISTATERMRIDKNGLIYTTSTGSLAARAAASTETTSTLTVASANRTIQATGDITIPNAVFSAGDIILIYAGASSRTITEGASVTMRLGGTATTGSRTLAARGVAMLFFVSSSEVIVSGGAVT